MERGESKKLVINTKIIPVSFKYIFTAVPYRLQNSWKEIFDVPIPWHMVYEMIHKTMADSKHRSFLFKLLYNISATNEML